MKGKLWKRIIALVLAGSMMFGDSILGVQATETADGGTSGWVNVSVNEFQIFGNNPETIVSEEQVKFENGDGTETNPYEIANAKQLQWIGQDMDAHYIQTADIDLQGIEWTPIGYGSKTDTESTAFSGSYDGNGFTIKNMSITENSVAGVNIGFFAANSGVIKNIKLKKVNIDVDMSYTQNNFTAVGAIVGRGAGISNCSVSGSISIKNANRSNVGGIVGSGSCTECCNYINITVSGTSYGDTYGTIACGGIAGYAGNVSSCVNYGNIEALADTFLYLGGIAGEDGALNKCINYGDIEGTVFDPDAFGGFGTHSNVGGIVGCTTSDSNSNCINFGDIIAMRTGDYGGCAAGGIAGYAGWYSNGEFRNCYNLGKIIQGADWAGRIAGSMGAAESCYSIENTMVNGSVPTDVGPTTIHGGSMTESEINATIKDIITSVIGDSSGEYINPADSSRDIPNTSLRATAGNENEGSSTEGPAAFVLERLY